MFKFEFEERQEPVTVISHIIAGFWNNLRTGNVSINGKRGATFVSCPVTPVEETFIAFCATLIDRA